VSTHPRTPLEKLRPGEMRGQEYLDRRMVTAVLPELRRCHPHLEVVRHPERGNWVVFYWPEEP